MLCVYEDLPSRWIEQASDGVVRYTEFYLKKRALIKPLGPGAKGRPFP